MEVNLKEEWTHDTLGSYGYDPVKKNPFNIYIIPKLLDDDVVNQLRDAINSSVKLQSKDNDLYKFKQSRDLKSQIQAKKLPPIIHEFIDVMMEPVRIHLEKITGKKLSEKNFDITASRYDVGNYLLCHNDDIKDNIKQRGRSLAFIYYLNCRNWTKDDGGSLVLYDSDLCGEPNLISNYIYPRPNTLIVFETTSKSWHAVNEVLCKDDFRLSINGWYHSKIENFSSSYSLDSEKSIETCPYELLKPIILNERLEKFFSETFNQEYLLNRTCAIIRKRFKKKSEINLTNFLVKEKYIEISNALKEATRDENNMTHVGPYNKRNYKVIKKENLPQVCKDLFEAFQSDLFFMLLSRLTGLDLIPPSINGSIKNGAGDGETEIENEEEDDDDDDDDEQEESDDDSEDDESDIQDDENDDDIEQDEEEVNEDEFEHEINLSEETKESGENSEESPIKDGNNSSKEETKVEELQNPETELTSKTKLQDTSTESTSRKLEKTSLDQSTSIASETSTGSNKRIKLNDEPASTSKDNIETIKTTSKKKRKCSSDPLSRIQFRHLQQGSYTLIHDYGYELGEKSALDVILHFNHDFEVNFDNGGYISYIDATPEDDLHDMDCELLTVEPKSNCLSLVYRSDEGTCRFLKHITRAHTNDYQDLYCVYYEKPDDLPHAN